jgi:hypothetical protein
MADTAGTLVATLSQQGTRCPMCGQIAWVAPVTPWVLPDAADSSNSLPLLRALCNGCGFLAWFQQNIPETPATL